MDFIELKRLLEHSIQRNPLPALAAGVTLAAFLFLLALQAIRAVRRRRSPNLTESNRSVNPLSQGRQYLKREGVWSQRETEQLERENDGLRDRVNHQEGRICA